MWSSHFQLVLHVTQKTKMTAGTLSMTFPPQVMTIEQKHCGGCRMLFIFEKFGVLFAGCLWQAVSKTGPRIF